MKRTYHTLPAAFVLLTMLAVAVGSAGASEPPYRLEHPVNEEGRRVSGDEGSVFTGSDIELSALVLDDDGRPASGVVVVFDQVAPAEKLLGKREEALQEIRVTVEQLTGLAPEGLVGMLLFDELLQRASDDELEHFADHREAMTWLAEQLDA